MNRRTILSTTWVMLAALALPFTPAPAADAAAAEGARLREALQREAENPGKPEWQPMLRYLADLHGRSVFPALAHLPHPYESIGPGYQGGRVFGHIDLAHIRLDTVRAAPEHVLHQIRNELAGQQADGLIPGIVMFKEDGKAWWKTFKGFPPFWVAAVDAYVEATGGVTLLDECLEALAKQIGWFETKRAAPGGGFYYLDILEDTWESGMDEGVRYHPRPPGASAYVDATAHVYWLYDTAARWSTKRSRAAATWEAKAEALRRFIQTELWDPDTGFFYDRWTVREPARRKLAFEGMWPVVVGAATPEQAMRVIGGHLMNPREFFAPHPIATVALNDPHFELRMWRGPTWNCMTYWAARGCIRYGRTAEARRLVEAALDATARQFARTGTVWEFYHPQGGEPESLKRKPTGKNVPNREYLGHNPLFAMVDLWRSAEAAR